LQQLDAACLIIPFFILEENYFMETTSAVSANAPRVDTHLAKFSQAVTVLLSALAFLLNQPILVAIAALILTLAAIVPSVSPFRLLYRYLVLPLHLLRPRIVEDDPAPHRFAQGVGAAFLIASSLLLYLTSATAVGWTLDLIVFVLAGINLTVGFCAGCFVYYHLGRLGILPRVRYEGGFHWRGV
jgi:Domain of unknown function (DUF4395)